MKVASKEEGFVSGERKTHCPGRDHTRILIDFCISNMVHRQTSSENGVDSPSRN